MARSSSSRSRGTRRSMGRSRSKIARVRGHGRTMAFRAGYGPGTPSIKKRNTYDALRRKGYSKSKAARIANAQANGTIDRGRRGPSRKR